MVKAAVILSGCGHLDGAEIRESVLSLLYLDEEGVQAQIFAPDIAQTSVINHLSGQPSSESRNVLVEAARIARGKIRPLSEADAKEFDLLVMPGGFGAAKNLSDFAVKGPDATVLPQLKNLIRQFHQAKKPIAAICIAPAVLAAALSDASPKVTIGEDAGVAGAIEKLGGKHQNCATAESVTDEQNLLVTCSAYMRDDRLSDIAKGIRKTIQQAVALAKKHAKKAA